MGSGSISFPFFGFFGCPAFVGIRQLYWILFRLISWSPWDRKADRGFSDRMRHINIDRVAKSSHINETFGCMVITFGIFGDATHTNLDLINTNNWATVCWPRHQKICYMIVWIVRVNQSCSATAPCDSKLYRRHKEGLFDRDFNGIAFDDHLLNIFWGFRYFHIRRSIIKIKRDGFSTNNWETTSWVWTQKIYGYTRFGLNIVDFNRIQRFVITWS